jgi:hypothetical protein
MSYDYIRRTYNVTPRVGQRVRHTETGKHGEVTREDPSAGHYVQVKFNGHIFVVPCHPLALEYFDD